jgi:hypothetical protein
VSRTPPAHRIALVPLRALVAPPARRAVSMLPPPSPAGSAGAGPQSY